MPILVTESGIIMDVKLVAPLNAISPIVVTSSGITIEVNTEFWKALLPISVSCESFSNIIEFNDEQLLNESQPM